MILKFFLASLPNFAMLTIEAKAIIRKKKYGSIKPKN